MKANDDLRSAAQRTPDPARAMKNLESFLEANPQFENELKNHIDAVSQLFAHSQFLAHFSIKNPEALFRAVRNLKKVEIRHELSDTLSRLSEGADYDAALALFREFKKEIMIGITLRDIMKISDTAESMEQMSDLADAMIEVSSRFVKNSLVQKYGEPARHAFCAFALGKLGAQELNYSSDVDLIFVYGTEEGQTAGIRGPAGNVINSISNHEFYCRLAADIGKFLSVNTKDGFVYRVDLRLRPNGQRGDTALSLRSYEMYYESWGREWERLALIRARLVCGDKTLGNEFLEMIVPFVWRKYLDFSTIDEIRGLKAKIDEKFTQDDIKRGYGGIREIEFFIQAFQLIYGGREKLLRQRKTLIALYMLKQKNLIGEDDHALLSENYIHLRRIEHFLQMLNDIQTHALPADKDQRESLARKMGFARFDAFLKDLEERREKVREIYNLLFREDRTRKPGSAISVIFDEEMEEAEREAYLMTKGIIDTGEALRNVARIKESVSSFHSLKGRRVLKEIAPGLVEAALSTSSPDRALKNLVHFLEMVSLNEAYLLSFRENIDLGNALVDVFSHSDYLSKLILSNPGYLDMLSGGTPKRKPLSRMKSELSGMVDTAVPLNTAVRVFKRSEEIRIGLMYLSKVVGVRSLMRGLSKVAEAVVDYAMKAVCEELALSPGNEVCVTAMGKFGGREITIGSDLDILFYVPGDLLEEHAKAAERFLKAMQLYTSDGIAYKVDTRLRPDGSKGPLISSIQGYGDYYRKNASNWEIQALLKARPVSSSRKGLCAFMEMREEAIRGRAPAISGEEILKMRTRIMTELGSPKGGIDIKIHKGGIGEIEFLVQFLQLKNAGRMVLYQDTLRALKILGESGTLAENDVSYLKESYLIYREIETYLRLSIMNTIKESDQETRYLAAFLGSGSVDEFIKGLRERMVRVSGIADRIYGQ